MTHNNDSRRICKETAKKYGWEKESYRNVVSIGNKKYSFSVSYGKYIEARQYYSDTDGLISLHNDQLYFTDIQPTEFSVSRITSNGIIAHNLKMNIDDCVII